MSELPFKHELRRISADARSVNLHEMIDSPHSLVRERIIQSDETSEAVVTAMSEGTRFFGNMRNNYRLPVVNMQSVLGKNQQGETALFTIVDRIEGEDLLAAKKLPTEAKEKLETLWISLCTYYNDAWKTQRTFWGDCKNSQFMYGHRVGSSENDFHIVDVDPIFFKPGENEFYTIPWCVNSLAFDLIENEKKFDPPIHLDKARNALLKLINTILDNDPQSEPLIAAKNILTL